MRLHAEQTAAVIVDVQERLLPHMDGAAAIEAHIITLVSGLSLLGVPVLSTEQYPRGLGATVPAVAAALEQARADAARGPVEKLSFSCCDEPAFAAALGALGRQAVVLAGIESHVCVLQTAIDLVAGGYQPVVVADCVASRSTADREVALRRMQQEGVLLSTCESLLFELCRRAGSDTFKAISQLVK